MPNRLAHETSPYLQQHADNPVDWYPWGDEALQRARAENKPILLSVGYSACHWCHVMAHESFEDENVAAAMNRLFVNIKVDREERPDLDQIYQTAHQLLTRRSGGWPLTMFLTPDQKPFFGGTYFPKTPRHGLIVFLDLLDRIATAYAEQPAEIAEQNEALLALLRQTVTTNTAPVGSLSDRPIEAALRELKQMFEPVNGGFGGAPKFPHPAELQLCLAEGVRRDDREALHVALFTLSNMAEGGIYDQLGGGFCRYSVDAEWTIPHFEKMLYDNGPLLALFADAWLLSGDTLFEQVCEETARWTMREMQAPQGGYYSSLDADSEHVEGKFYVWSRDEVAQCLSEAQYAVLAAHYGLDLAPNFEGEHWHLRIARPLAQVATQLGLNEDAARALLREGRARLFATREQRVRPGRDEKVLTSWNALMTYGMAHAGRVFGNDEWVVSAQRALDFVRSQLWRDDRLLATAKDGNAHLDAYLDDHAFLLIALLESMQARFRYEDLQFAKALADVLLDRFEDRSGGGFFFTGSDHEALILRTKPGSDNATPSGNGVAAVALQRLGHLIGEARYLAAAERTMQAFFDQMQQRGSAYSTLAIALAEYTTPPTIVILRGVDPDLGSWRQQLAQRYRPSTLSFALPNSLIALPETMNKPPADAVNAWVCRGVSCLPPLTNEAELESALSSD